MKQLVEARLYRDAGAVKRYHTQRTLRPQSVGEHSFGVLMLIRQLHPDCSRELVWTALHHDLPELMTGDIPAPAKRAHPEMDTYLEEFESSLAPLYYAAQMMDPEEALLLKWADTMELVLWCLEEYRMGNHTVGMCDMIRRGLGWILARRVPIYAQNFTDEVVDDATGMGLAPFRGAQLETMA
jgi:5'-deoxynucleotidase YfbR-like HD superfamily hydrolase